MKPRPSLPVFAVAILALALLTGCTATSESSTEPVAEPVPQTPEYRSDAAWEMVPDSDRSFVIVHTTDKGATWDEQYSVEGYPLGNFVSLDGNDCSLFYASEDVDEAGTEYYTRVVRTSDAGESWQEYRTAPGFVLKSVVFVDENLGWANAWTDGDSGSNTLLRTSDGGQTWVTQYMCESEDSNVGGPSFVDAQHGWAPLGRPFSDGNPQGVLLVTSDGGESWQERILPDGLLALGVHSVDAETGVAVGIDIDTASDSAEFVMIGIEDGGRSCAILQRGQELEYGINIGDGPEVRSIGDLQWCAPPGSGYMFRSIDRGDTWETLEMPDDVYSVTFLDDMNGWACSGSAGILHTSDGGKTWAESAIRG